MHRIFTLFLIAFFTTAGTAATFTSLASGNYTVAGTWSQVGVDADGIPDQGDDVVISTGHTVTLVTNSHARNITIDPGGTLVMNTFTMLNWGSLTQNGIVSGIGAWQFRLAGTYTGNPLNYNGNVYFYNNYTIASGVILSKNIGSIIISSGVQVTNNGTVNLNNSGSGYIQFLASSSRWINAANSSLSVSADFIGAGSLQATAVPNNVTYKTNGTTNIKATSYYNLILQATTSPNVKALQGSITVANDLTISSPVRINWANFNISLGGDWINNANLTGQNIGSLNFTGTGTQTITRNPGNIEVFNIINCNGLGTVLLNDTIRTNGSILINIGTLDVSASNYSIHCRGNFVNQSIFNARQGIVYMDGTIAQSIDGSSPTTFYDLTADNAAGVSVASAQSVTNNLRVINGSFGPSAFGSVTLVASSATTCARIGGVGTGASLTGTTWIIQTYIDGPATAYWQYLGSPTQSSTLADWDNDNRFYMSGVGGNDGNACCPVFRSVRVYTEATNAYGNITSTGQALIPARGFMVWMSDNMSGLTQPLIYDTRGTPSFGTVNRAVTAGGAGGGYNLVANPYACPVTYSSVVSASSATLNPDFLILTESGSYVTSPNGGTIAGGQGFMCLASAGGNITFNEGCKSQTANPNVIRATAGNEIIITAGNEVNGLGEQTIIRLNPLGDESYDGAMDLPYLASPYDNATHLWTSNNYGAQFLINDLGTLENHLMIPLTVVSSTTGTQSLAFKNLNTVTEYNCAWLEDLETGARISLNTTDTYTYQEEELGISRSFILHFERTSDCTFDLQNTTSSLEAQTNVFVNSGQVYAGFGFETEEVVTVSMFDLSGRMIMGETTMNVGTQTIALNNPDAHGIYLVRIVKGTEVVTKKFYY